MLDRPQRLRLLVTGGAGFLGSHLCDRLLAEGCDVLCVDTLDTGRLDNLDAARADPGFHFLEQDVAERFDAEVDGILNLACPASPPRYQRDPIQTVKTSVLGAFNLLDLAHRRRVPILQASTSEVYGDPQVHPQREDYWGHVNPIGLRACYDEGKRCAETLFFDYHRRYGLDVKVARIFNTYGPRMDPEDGRVVSNFVVQALRGEPITLYGDGRQTRSFCYVDDLVEGLVRLFRAPRSVQGPINLGNASEVTVRELADHILDLTGSRSSLVHRPLPADDPRQRRPDTARAREVLGWEARTPLREGLRRTIAHVERQLTGARSRTGRADRRSRIGASGEATLLR